MSVAAAARLLGRFVEIFCPQCGYNLYGIPEIRCPECGFQYDRRAIEDLATFEARERAGVYGQVIAHAVMAVTMSLMAMLGAGTWNILERWVALILVFIAGLSVRRHLSAAEAGIFDPLPWPLGLFAVITGATISILLPIVPIALACGYVLAAWRRFITQRTRMPFTTISLPEALRLNLKSLGTTSILCLVISTVFVALALCL